MAKTIMIQGAMSNVGKSVLTAGLCRVLRQDGFRAAPFKSQNMALNSFITPEGLEIGRAQAMQAEAAGIEPSAAMNPILLKPNSDMGSQVIVNGEVVGNMKAKEYFAYKKKLIPDILRAYEKLSAQADIIVIEGAGSPAEINLKDNDIVNMGLAELLDAPVLLVGDIDRGGVFAQLLGTLLLLEEKERARVKGLVINKFRGDRSILEPGIRMLEERGGIPVTGVIPYMQLVLEDEDSLTERFSLRKDCAEKAVDIAVIRFPHISNFTDFMVFEQFADVSLRYVDSVSGLGEPDMIILPGSKNTMGDLKWTRQNGLEAAVLKRAEKTVIFGICGGYQMLGNVLRDPGGVEEGGVLRGMELLPMETELGDKKIRTQVRGVFHALEGEFSELSGMELCGYEIHMGRSRAVPPEAERQSLCVLDVTAGEDGAGKEDGCFLGHVYGTYVHGIFDADGIAETVVRALAKKKGVVLKEENGTDYRAFKEAQYDSLAEALREALDMQAVRRIIGI